MVISVMHRRGGGWLPMRGAGHGLGDSGSLAVLHVPLILVKVSWTGCHSNGTRTRGDGQGILRSRLKLVFCYFRLFYWPKQVTGPRPMSEGRLVTPLLEGWAHRKCACKRQGRWRTGTTDAFNLPDVLPFKVIYRLKSETVVKNLPANTGDARDIGSIPVGKIPWRRKW